MKLKNIRRLDGVVAFLCLTAALLSKYNGDTDSAIFWILGAILCVIPMDRRDASDD